MRVRTRKQSAMRAVPVHPGPLTPAKTEKIEVAKEEETLTEGTGGSNVDGEAAISAEVHPLKPPATMVELFTSAASSRNIVMKTSRTISPRLARSKRSISPESPSPSRPRSHSESSEGSGSSLT